MGLSERLEDANAAGIKNAGVEKLKAALKDASDAVQEVQSRCEAAESRFRSELRRVEIESYPEAHRLEAGRLLSERDELLKQVRLQRWPEGPVVIWDSLVLMMRINLMPPAGNQERTRALEEELEARKAEVARVDQKRADRAERISAINEDYGARLEALRTHAP